jgi:para-aminobenzoate synthetase / 4-amino-4-deoxychorismate lyase
MNPYDDQTVILHDAACRQWLAFQRPLQVLVARTLDAVTEVLREVEQQTTANGRHAAGFLAYEAAPAFDPALVVRPPTALPLAWFGIYGAPAPMTVPPPEPTSDAALHWSPSVSPAVYRAALQRVKAYIRAGDTYQVNYSFRLRTPFVDDPWPFFVHMVHAQGAGYSAFVNAGDWTLCSASPELFFRLDGTALGSQPMKGTAARGRWPADDVAQAAWLQNSAKNRAENVMIVDMMRNDLGRVAIAGSVHVPRLYDVAPYPTLWQMTSTVDCTTHAGIAAILGALFPAASITGAPKARTMQIIAELEEAPRAIYTGAIGFVAPNRVAQFNVAIRTVLVDRTRRTAEYGVGGGIVWDSEEDTEFGECQTKARVLTQRLPDFALLETLLWVPGEGYWLLDRHLQRLADSAAYFARAVDLEALRTQLAALAQQLPAQPHRVRLLAPRNGAPVLEPHVLTPLPQPYRIRLAAGPVCAADPFLYHKTTRRQVYEEALRAAPGADDVLLWNEKEELTESCIASVVVERDGRLLTPPLASGLLPGTFRAELLEQGRITEAVILRQDLARGGRVWLVNSVRGMWAVALGHAEAQP